MSTPETATNENAKINENAKNNENANINDNNIECPVCFDSIGNKNSCVTTCGHRFCLNCLLQSYNTLNNCPLCRETLNVNEKTEDDDDDDDDYDDEDDDDDDGDDDSVTLLDSVNDDEDYDDDMSESTNQTNDITKLATIENITAELKKNGFSMKDVVSMYLDRPSIKDTHPHTVDGKILFYTVEHHYEERKTLFDKIIDDLDAMVKCEHDENTLMGIEDNLLNDAVNTRACMNLLTNLPFSMVDIENEYV
jgi:hypothetical protein